MNQRKAKTAKPEGTKAKRTKAGKTPEPEPVTTLAEAKAMAVKEDSLFEFYKIFPYGPPRGGMQPCKTRLCDPPCQSVSKANLQTTLATVCADAYGEGDFIALRVGADSKGQSQGLPDAYWLIRVKPNKHGIPCRKAEQIALDDEDHAHLETLKRHPALILASEEDEQRERGARATEEETGKLIEIEGRPYIVTRDELVKFDHEHGYSYHENPWAALFRDYAASRDDIDPDEWRRLGDPYQLQRGTLAGQMAAKYFDLMPNPQAGEGMRPHDYIRLRMSQGADRDEIISELTDRAGPFRLPLSKATTFYNSVMRSEQMKRKKERERQKEQGQANPPVQATKKRAKK